MPTKFLSANMKVRDPVGDLSVDRIILKQVLKTYGMRAWTGFKRLRIASSGGLLRPL
jgi:hypothetical protein